MRRFELVPAAASGKVQYRVQTVRGNPFDREVNAQVPLQIRCTDPDAPALVGEANAIVQVRASHPPPPPPPPPLRAAPYVRNQTEPDETLLTFRLLVCLIPCEFAALRLRLRLRLQVLDINDNPPKFDNSTYLLRIAENNDPNIPILEYVQYIY